MKNSIQPIRLDKLSPHPENPNLMSKTNFNKLLRNIELSGIYEPLIVRPDPRIPSRFQIINGHHRFKVLQKLGYEYADCIVWNVDDYQTDILLATLNRLCGRDDLDIKLKLLKKLNTKLQANALAKLVPQTASQIQRLVNMKPPTQFVKLAELNEKSFVSPLVFFLSDSQKQTVQNALSLAANKKNSNTKAQKNADAITKIARFFIKKREKPSF